jgi:hypothetical protein
MERRYKIKPAADNLVRPFLVDILNGQNKLTRHSKDKGDPAGLPAGPPFPKLSV